MREVDHHNICIWDVMDSLRSCVPDLCDYLPAVRGLVAASVPYVLIYPGDRIRPRSAWHSVRARGSSFMFRLFSYVNKNEDCQLVSCQNPKF